MLRRQSTIETTSEGSNHSSSVHPAADFFEDMSRRHSLQSGAPTDTLTQDSTSVYRNATFRTRNHNKNRNNNNSTSIACSSLTHVDQDPWTLRFRDNEIEKRYVQECYFSSANIHRNKLFAVVYAVFSLYIFYFIYQNNEWTNSFVIAYEIMLSISAATVTYMMIQSDGKNQHTSPAEDYEWLITIAIVFALPGQILARSVGTELRHDNLADTFLITRTLAILLKSRHYVLARSYIPGCIVAIVYITIEHGALYATWVLFVVFPVAIGYVLDMQARTQFLHVDRAERRLRRIAAHTELMEATLLAALPHTARDQLLGVYHHASTLGTPAAAQRVVGCLYPDTAVVVTDACGFTAWATRTVPLDVVYMLGRLFRELDAAAMSWGVEKLCTVGDSYVGVVFGPRAADDQHPDRSSLTNDKLGNLGRRDDEASSGQCHPTDVSRRVLNAVHFAIDAARLPHQLDLPLRNRVGVQVGAVYAGFVGYAPPVFDAFGTAVVEAKELEASGVPSRVHVSPIVLTHCERSGCGSAVDVTSTSRGVLITGWIDHEENGFLRNRAASSRSISLDVNHLRRGSMSMAVLCTLSALRSSQFTERKHKLIIRWMAPSRLTSPDASIFEALPMHILKQNSIVLSNVNGIFRLSCC
eukprot:PhM_4_TR10023/c4_g1_i3/m.95042